MQLTGETEHYQILVEGFYGKAPSL